MLLKELFYLVCVEGGLKLLVPLDVLHLVSEAVENEIIRRVADGETGEAARDLLLK